MDPLLQLALQNVDTTARGAIRAAKAGELGTAALEFSQASMILGMQIGHQRARLGQRFVGSPESKMIDQCAARLATSITLAYALQSKQVLPLQPAAVPQVPMQEELSDDDIEVDVAYGTWSSEESE